MKRIRLWNITPPLYNEEFMRVDDNKIAMSMDAYFIDDGEVHPAMIICPGGGYRYRNENEAGGVAGWLNTLGLSAFVLNYRVKPYDFPAPIVDGKRAIKFIRKFSGNMKIDPEKIGIMGFSSGAHLAALTAEVSDIKIIITQKIMNKISTDIDNNQQTPQAEMYSLMNILKNLPQVKQHTDSLQHEQKQNSKNFLSPEHVRQIEREILGME